MNPTDAYIKARSAAIMTYVGEPHFAPALVDEAEALDPLLPVWCVEERGVALYALGRGRPTSAAATRGNVLLFCGGGNHVGLRGLPGGAEGIQTSDLRGAGPTRLAGPPTLRRRCQYVERLAGLVENFLVE
jgi:hypothetical protein